MLASATRAANSDERTTITADWDTYQGNLPGWWAVQNPWGAGKLTNGKHYRQAITVNRPTFPDGSVIRWTWPSYSNSDNAWGYPELVYGAQAGTWQSPDGRGPSPVQIKKLRALIGSYSISISGNTDQFDVLWETHLMSAPHGGSSVEFGILLHSPSYVTSWLGSIPKRYTYGAADLSATIIVTNNGTEPYILVVPRQGDMLSATVDIRSILNFLISSEVLTGNEYINGFEMGAEPRQGSGTLSIDSLGYNWNGNITGRGMSSRTWPPAVVAPK